MEILFDETKDTPIYKQIVDSIYSQIKTGALPPEMKLPTVRELAQETGISRGTIKHAYDTLERIGVIRMTQGRGTFVQALEAEGNASKKERAMAAIDRMLKELEELGFSTREMQIYIDLKLRAMEEKYDVVRLAVVDCNPETLYMISKQLNKISYAETVQFPLEGLEDAAERFNEDYDLIITTSTHYDQVQPYVADPEKLAKVAMTPSQRTVFQLGKIHENAKVIILCASDHFARIVQRNSAKLGKWAEEIPYVLLGDIGRVEAALSEAEAVLLPQSYGQFCSKEERECIQHFEHHGGIIILYEYKLDQGSLMYVEEVIIQCMNKKRSS